MSALPVERQLNFNFNLFQDGSSSHLRQWCFSMVFPYLFVLSVKRSALEMQEDPVGHGNLRHGCEHAGPKCHLHSMGQETQQITRVSLAGETWNPTSFKNPLKILGRIFRSDLRGPKARNNGPSVVIHIYSYILYIHINNNINNNKNKYIYIYT